MTRYNIFFPYSKLTYSSSSEELELEELELDELDELELDELDELEEDLDFLESFDFLESLEDFLDDVFTGTISTMKDLLAWSN